MTTYIDLIALIKKIVKKITKCKNTVGIKREDQCSGNSIALKLFESRSKMVLVKVSEGTLEGTHEQNEYGGSFYSFKGIPYAEPPIGALRFKAPVPPKPWKGVRTAREFGSECYQVNTLLFETEGKGSEDCLYLNVSTPDLKPAKPLPVMVWIHGGGFFSGSGSDVLYGPQYLIRHGIILVTLNYRLDVLGFLCLDIEEVPGNAGLKDQVAALRWVKNNISNFGGDPENITIFGESAGGASVSFHLMSPMTKGLFKRAIAQSGSSTCPWPKVVEPREKTIKFARKLGLKSTNPHEILEFLQSLPVEAIVKHDVPVMYDEQAILPIKIHFGVVSEKKFGDNAYFFSGDVFEVLRQGIHPDVEVMSGFNEHEGVFGLLVRGQFQNVEKTADFSEFYCPEDIRYNCSTKEALEVGRKLKQYHLKDEFVTKENIWSIIRYCSLEDFIFGAIRWQKIAAKSSSNKFYFYKFTCKSELNVFTDVLGLRDLLGPGYFVCHAEDLMYQFPSILLRTKLDLKSKEFQMINTVTTLWTNFAKYGNPTPDSSLGVQWTPYTLESQDYLDIGEKLVPGKKPEQEDIQFWEEIYRKYLPAHIL